MFTFEDSAGKEFKITFSHDREIVQANPFKANSRPHLRPKATVCQILDGENVVATSKSVCHTKDRFNYRTGRRIALTRALAVAGFDLDSRRNAWKAMLSSTNVILEEA